MSVQPHITVLDLRQGVRDLDLSGRVLCVHSSLRAFGWVEGGANAVLDALLLEGCTVMTPTFSESYMVVPPDDMLLERNGWTPGDQAAGVNAHRIFDVDTEDIDADMGAIPAALLRRPEHVRGHHPLNSFSAVGPAARVLVSGQQPLDVYAPLRSLIAHDGVVLQMGVGLTRLTLLHLAEQEAGRTLFRRWALGESGSVIAVETGCCSEGFDAFQPVLARMVRETRVGSAIWRAYPATATLAAAAAAIRANPRITRCGDRYCERCDDAIAGGPLLA